MFEAGANYFILSVKPRVMIPMHYFHRAEVAMEYARTASCRTTEVVALPGYGEMLSIGLDEEGYLNLSFPEEPELPDGETDSAKAEENAGDPLLPENDPFLETDLPLSQLAEPEAGGENDPETPGKDPGETAPEA